ncbi:MAG: acyltransferase family protein [Ramlibacter sp.]
MKNDSANLDLLRTIAVALVVVSHASPFIGGQGLVDAFNWYTFGRIGVALFFVHTTLVLMLSLERHGPAAAPFFVRRFFRIWPLAAFMVLVMVLLRLRFHEPVSAGAVVANLLLVQNLTGDVSMPDQLWTLPFEVQMYLALPALFLLTRTRGAVLSVAALCAGALVLGLAAFFTVWRGRTDVVTPFHYIPCFLPGVLAYVLARRRRGTWSPLVLFAFVLAAAVVVPALVTAGIPETPLFWVLCLGLGLLIPMCRELTIEPVARAAKVVATYSYGIYLTHVLAIGFGLTGLMAALPAPARWSMALLLLAGMPFAVYRLIERPGIELGRRLADRLQRRRAFRASGPARTSHRSARRSSGSLSPEPPTRNDWTRKFDGCRCMAGIGVPHRPPPPRAFVQCGARMWKRPRTRIGRWGA